MSVNIYLNSSSQNTVLDPSTKELVYVNKRTLNFGALEVTDLKEM